MPTISRTLWPVLLGALFVIALGWNVFYAHSVDIGLHYTLANEIFERLGQSGIGKERLGVMFEYPAGAHWLAALLALITKSPLLSINLLTELSTYVAYVCIVLLLIGPNRVVSLARITLMLICVWWLSGQQAAFGYQVVVNFFFPQLLGETLVLAFLYFLSLRYFWTLPRADQTVVFVAITWLLGYVQPISALQFGGTATVLIVLSVLVPFHMSKETLRKFLQAMLTCAFIAIAVALHPALLFMMKDAEHNGYLRFGEQLPASNYKWLAVLATIAAGMAIVGAIRGNLMRRRALVLGAASLAGAILLLAQKVLLAYFNIASEYAVSKHVFFLATISSTTFVYAMFRDFHAANTEPNVVRNGLDKAAPIFAIVAMSIVFGQASRWRHDLRPALEYEAYAKHFHRYLAPVDSANNVVSLNKAVTPTINYLISFGDLKLRYDIAMASVTSSAIVLNTPVKYAMVSSQLLSADELERCSVGIPPSLKYAVVDRKCFAQSLSAIEPEVAMGTGLNQRGAEYLKKGWGPPESWGTWSIATNARIEFTIAPQRDASHFDMVIKYIAFIAGARQAQAFSVLVDGQPAGRQTASSSAAREFTVAIDGSGHHTIDVNVDNPVSPRELGLSSTDERKLGIGLLEMRLIPRS